MKPTTLKEFLEFLKEYNVIALAIAFVVGAASNQLVSSLVNNIFMPMITPLIPGGAWEDATLNIGSASLKWGALLADALNFVIIAGVVFVVVKKIMRLKK